VYPDVSFAPPNFVLGTEAPVRQWVLPVSLRCRLAYDPKLCIAVQGVFLRSVFGALQRRAREKLGVVVGQSGSSRS
jgi:hypothetical protein